MLDRLKRKAQKLEWLEFLGHDRAPALTLDISPEELQVELAKIPAPLFLGRYSRDDLRAKLERNQVLPELRRLGFDPLIVEVHSDGLIEHRIIVHTGEAVYNKILLELRLREGIFKVRDSISKIHSELEGQLTLDTIPMLWIDWLLLQNPFAQFAPGKAPLPEQKYPGLGLLNLVVPLIGEFAIETRKQAVLDIPEHFHGARFYSKWMKFFNPEMEGKMAAILRDLQGTPLPLISWGIRMDGLFNLRRGGFEDWKPGEQIYPLSPELTRYFNSQDYLELKEKALVENKYRLDLDKIQSRLKFLDPDEKQIVEGLVKN